MKRYGRSGWFGQSHRHYLAAKGISTKRYYDRKEKVEKIVELEEDYEKIRKDTLEELNKDEDAAREAIRKEVNPTAEDVLENAKKTLDVMERAEDKRLEYYQQRLDNLLIENTRINMRMQDIVKENNPDKIDEMAELGARRQEIVREEQEVRDMINMMKRNKSI